MTQFGTPPRLGSLTPDTLADAPEERLARMMQEDATTSRQRVASHLGVDPSRHRNWRHMRNGGGGNPRLSEQRKARAEKQRAATHQRIANALRHGKWLSTPAIAERLNTSPGHVRKRLMEMRAEGDVERRTVSGPRGGVVVEWRLA